MEVINKTHINSKLNSTLELFGRFDSCDLMLDVDFEIVAGLCSCLF